MKNVIRYLGSARSPVATLKPQTGLTRSHHTLHVLELHLYFERLSRSIIRSFIKANPQPHVHSPPLGSFSFLLPLLLFVQQRDLQHDVGFSATSNRFFTPCYTRFQLHQKAFM